MIDPEVIANIEAKHDTCDGYDGCGCFDRLLAAVRGEPDPDGEFYRWPIYRYGCEEPPVHGCETPIGFMIRGVQVRIAKSIYEQNGILLNAQFAGLAACLDTEPYGA